MIRKPQTASVIHFVPVSNNEPNQTQNQSRWHEGEQELVVDLERLLNESRLLVLTGWQHPQGIS